MFYFMLGTIVFLNEIILPEIENYAAKTTKIVASIFGQHLEDEYTLWRSNFGTCFIFVLNILILF